MDVNTHASVLVSFIYPLNLSSLLCISCFENVCLAFSPCWQSTKRGNSFMAVAVTQAFLLRVDKKVRSLPLLHKCLLKDLYIFSMTRMEQKHYASVTSTVYTLTYDLKHQILGPGFKCTLNLESLKFSLTFLELILIFPDLKIKRSN